ncbi:MAG: hypothetical protein NTV80_22215 [Verrucomicrobia bacterium]|nr:hypothetical protein [Verrucomicrobiota bacterium]
MITLLLLHAFITWMLCGLIWTVQVVHYPLFEDVGHENFSAYHGKHMWLITWIVMPLMFLEVASAGLLLFWGEHSWPFLVSLAALAVAWLSTAVYQVPMHDKLVRGYDAEIIRRLVLTNWWRTLAWTLRGLCLAGMLHDLMSKI